MANTFSRGCMDTRVGALKSRMSQLSQKFFFVFIAPPENFLHYLEVGGNPFFRHINGVISKSLTSKITKKFQYFFLLKIVTSLFSHVFVFSPMDFQWKLKQRAFQCFNFPCFIFHIIKILKFQTIIYFLLLLMPSRRGCLACFRANHRRKFWIQKFHGRSSSNRRHLWRQWFHPNRWTTNPRSAKGPIVWRIILSWAR